MNNNEVTRLPFPTLEVGVFLLEKDKMLYYYDNRLRVNPISFHFPEFLYLLSSSSKLPTN